MNLEHKLSSAQPTNVETSREIQDNQSAALLRVEAKIIMQDLAKETDPNSDNVKKLKARLIEIQNIEAQKDAQYNVINLTDVLNNEDGGWNTAGATGGSVKKDFGQLGEGKYGQNR